MNRRHPKHHEMLIKGLSMLLVHCFCKVNPQYNGVGEIFSFDFTDAGRSCLVYGNAGRDFLEASVKQQLELLVVLITKSQGATQRRRRHHIIFR